MPTEMTMDETALRLARLQLHAVFMRPTQKYDTASDHRRELMRRHLQSQLEIGDKVLVGTLDDFGRAGSLDQFRSSTRPGERLVDASGMYFMIAPSREAAEAIALSEPVEAAGCRMHALRDWQLREGTAVPLVRSMIESSREQAGESL